MSSQEDKGARRPFPSIPDIQSYYPSLASESARVQLARTLERGEGAAILFGEVGLGKTLLLRLLADQFELNAPVIFLSSARIASRRSFYLHLLFQVHSDTSPADEDDLRVRFFEHLRRSDYGFYTLFVDNADNLSAAVIDELCSFLDIGYYGNARFRIALSGTSRFEERLNAPKFSRFSQRIATRCWLDPFSRDETHAYLDRQMELSAADYGGLKFSADAAKRVHKLSEGVPRVINQICDLALYLESSPSQNISEKTIEKAWRLLQQIPEDEASSDPVSETANSKDDPCSPSGFSKEDSASSVLEFGSLDSSEEDGNLREEISCSSNGSYDESPSVEFGPLDNEPLLSSISDPLPPDTSPVPGVVTEKEIVSEEETCGETVLPIVPKFSLPEDAHLHSDIERNGENNGCSCSENDGVEVLSMDGQTIEWHSGGDSDAVPDCSKSRSQGLFSSDSDLTVDTSIYEERVHDSSQASAKSVPDAFQTGARAKDAAEEIPRYLEELRLMEMDIAQEADLIRKIREMETGLHSFQTPPSSEPEPKTGNCQERPSLQNRSFRRVFEKIYMKKDKEP